MSPSSIVSPKNLITWEATCPVCDERVAGGNSREPYVSEWDAKDQLLRHMASNHLGTIICAVEIAEQLGDGEWSLARIEECDRKYSATKGRD